MAKRFSDALATKVEDFQRPPNLPAGHYTFQVTKHADISEFESRDGVTFDRVTFTCTPVAAQDDVDEDELSQFGDYSKVAVRKQFLIPDGEQDAAGYDNSMFNVRRFLEHCGIKEDVPLGEALADAVMTQFMGELNHRPDKNNPEIVYQEIGRTALAE